MSAQLSALHPPPDRTPRPDALTISLVAVAHGLSHFFQLTLPPLFPLIQRDLGVSFIALGGVLSVFYVSSGIAQVASGFAVDRFGARRVLFSGTALMAGGLLLAAMLAHLPGLFLGALCMGIGNGVFHPANFAILNGRVSTRHLGYAYSVHGVGGSLGYVVAPVVSFGLGSLLGWRLAAGTMGLFGVLVLAVLIWQRSALAVAARGSSDTPFLAASIAVFRERAIRLCFAFFALATLAVVIVQTFVAPALHLGFALSLGEATSAVATYLLASAVGMLAGGVLATHTRRHDRVAATGLGTGALMLLLVGLLSVPYSGVLLLLAAAGFAIGSAAPSRDMIVKHATPAGATGRTYGFVYSGIDLGAMLAPVVAGALIDRGAYHAVFFAAAGVLVLAIATVLFTQPGHRVAAVAGAAGD